ncbi:MAG: zeta toxin family protein [Sphingomonadaceae bacterium]
MATVAPRPTLFVIAGPNGAGKTSFYETVLARRIAAPFVNADIIQRDELDDSPPEASYRAARIAERRRRVLVAERRSFVFETVFSHPSKLDFLRDARAAGFRIILFHLNVASADIAVARVKARKTEGGHDVPENKIRERYDRNRALIREAALIADRAQILDSSALNEQPRVLLEVSDGRLVSRAKQLPRWCRDLYGDLF